MGTVIRVDRETAVLFVNCAVVILAQFLVEPATQCWTGQHLNFMPFDFLFVLVYCLGIPGGAFLFLRSASKRGTLSSERVHMSVGFL